VSADDDTVHCRWRMRRRGRNDVELRFTGGASRLDLDLLYGNRDATFEPIAGSDAKDDGAEAVTS
jgi:hypothetical protein